MTVIAEGFEHQASYQELYDAGIIPPFLDRAIKPDGTRMTTDEIIAYIKTLRSHDRKAAKLKLAGKRHRKSGLGMSLAELKASVTASKGA